MRISGFVVAASLLVSACSSPGQLVLGIATDLPARDQIDYVSLVVTRRGETTPTVTHGWALSGVPAQDFRLPGSFNLFASSGEEPTFDVVIQGLLGGVSGRLQVQRNASLGILKEEDLFIRLGLVASCEQLACPASLTCVEGLCRPKLTDLRTLPRYRAELVDHIDCSSGTVFIDTSTHLPLPAAQSCASGSLCSEGTCLIDPATLPLPAGTQPFVGDEAELFGAASQGFFSVGPLDVARYAASATLLGDGTVLVLGGFNSAATDGTATPLTGAVIYDPDAGAFHAAAPPPIGLGGQSATSLGDGRVLVVGTFMNMPKAYVYDPTTAQYASLASPNAARYFHTATSLPNGKVLLYGGTTQNGPLFVPANGAELFDPKTNSFTQTLGSPIVQRMFHAATALADGRVLITGGFDMNGNALLTSEIYDVTTDKFTSAAPLASARGRHTATALSDGTVLVVGGQNALLGPALPDAELYSLAEQTSTAFSPPPFPRTGQRAVSLGGDRILFVGGEQPNGHAAGGAYVFDPSARNFAEVPGPKLARLDAFALALADGDILIGGGAQGMSSLGDGGIMMADGGLNDGGPAFDMQSYCDPVGLAANPMCPANMRRCTISGEIDYGPHLVSDAAPRCVSDGTILAGEACTPGDKSGGFDQCVAGTVCLADASGMPVCQTVCRYDSDCPQVLDMGVSTPLSCARVAVGPSIGGFGVCMHPCDVFNAEDCMPYNGMCRYVAHQTSATAAVQADGICVEQGNLEIGAPCTGADEADECSLNESCVGGTCVYLCDDQARCDANFGGTCTGIVTSQPTTNGYCATPKSDLGAM